MEMVTARPSCVGHPGVDAQGPCLSCGRWACDVCALPAVAGLLCPVCASERMPWEDRGQLGFWRGFARTLVPSMFAPEELFGRLQRRGPVAPALGYAAVTHLIGASTPALLSVSSSFGFAGSPADRLVSSLSLLGAVTLLWLAADVLLALLIHGTLAILGEAQATFGATVRAVCYGGGVGVLYATILLPSIFVPQVWATLTTIQAIRLSHRTTPGRATTAVLVPTLACMIAGLTVLKLLAPSMVALKG
jgi:hypothetical protein